MNRQFNSRLLAAILMITFSSTMVVGQIDNYDFLKAGAYDASKLTEAYFAPWAKAFGAGSNGSWYNTAKPHKFGGFDLTFGLNVGMVPATEDTYDLSKIGLKNFTGTGMAPTISGPNNDGPTLTSKPVSGIAPLTFETPPGTGWKWMPVPTLQAGIGLPLGTEVKIRYIPKISISKGDISSWGVGLLHSITQYFPGDELLPFDISVFGGYSKLTMNIPINMLPGTPQFYTSKFPVTAWDNQNLGMVAQAWNASAIASLNLPVLTLYGGLGYSSTATNINMTGNFPMPTVNPAMSATEYVYEDAGVVKDFPEIEIKNYSGLRANAGLRLKFSVITLHADYTWAQYSVVSAGMGISFR
ncbi:MAG: hypothetical protein IPN68_12345 [Bacteroidetes bacterium]|nr:hypothetical protein [Bacteroidota bacterium]